MKSAVIVAGGRSTRFGSQDKAVAELAGTPMIRRVADRIADVVEAVVVNCRTEQVPAIREAMAGYPRRVTFAVDPEPDRGPMAGIMTGLRGIESIAGPDAPAFVVACDMPFVDPGFVEYLFDRVDGYDAAVPRLDDQWFQTTHAVYRAAPMAEACQVALDRGDRKIIEPLFDLNYVVVEEEHALEYTTRAAFENLNTREEFRRAEERVLEREGR
ncbi:Molybdopterin-guanine dinucleotide biosynthesis protein A [Halalkaliarchaeum sp. AArc-CO]|uniref:molybdenum cofactor guanylyltransferase n=1 Tax=unclassified Halalkaliarchaeum TaxID=2678344 RepID=UPI00217D9A5F|nr:MULTISPECIES: molybdenum cofactor guanylyltransferase [unclassified Halalkaliarchaeum]MDR5674549.1 molybdenum cofactor guanylyltransferase [Halalkaliarchaeum sp. AArc-GB]UWG49464.1 Molybdopterin-guanine dinucleotide biosynthesis protein A [Halalkaliarchaeum sp. AArc-CO]